MCQGYYRHSQGYTPEWPGMDSFKGEIVHPQNWPEDIDLTGKRVVVICSGATAATIVPAIAAKCAHVTLLQRSPTYFITGRNANILADTLRELDIDESWIHEIVRRKILFDQSVFTRRCETEPEVVTRELLGGVKAYLGESYDVARHFTPRYAPWKQRIAFIPDGDLFRGIRSGKASVVTDEIDTYNETGLLLKSGQSLAADAVVTATGLDLLALGGLALSVDGRAIALKDTLSYKGMMLSGLPNLAFVFGYTNASWTLKADLPAASSAA
jgi:cation diffusion facilitator CzcD-associated flavoprotein CzcO